MKLVPILALALSFSSGSLAYGQAPYTHRVDVALGGLPVSSNGTNATISADGNTVVFASGATNMTATALPELGDLGLFAKDVRTGKIELLNLGSSGQILSLKYGQTAASVSADGRFVAFVSAEDDLGMNDTNGGSDIYLRDRLLGVTELVSATVSGTTPLSGIALRPTISADGNLVAFLQRGDNLSPVPLGGSGFTFHAYVRDRQKGTTVRLTESISSSQDETAYDVVLSGDGSTAVVWLKAWGSPTFVLKHYDVATGIATPLIPVGGFPGVGGLTIDRSGSRVAILTIEALVPEDTDSNFDIYTLNLSGGGLQLASTSTLGASPAVNVHVPSLSPDGRYLAFNAEGQGWVPFPVTEATNVYLRDLDTGLTTLASINDLAQPGAAILKSLARLGSSAALSEGGRAIVFDSNYLNLAKPNSPGQLGEYYFGVFRHEFATSDTDLSIAGLVAGGTASLTVTDASPNAMVLVGLSIAGQTPVSSYWGVADLTPPWHVLTLAADPQGFASMALPVSSSLAGVALYAKGVDVTASVPTTSFFAVIQ